MLSVKSLADFLEAEILSGEAGLVHALEDPGIASMGVELISGELSFSNCQRVITLGKRESSIWDTLTDEVKKERLVPIFEMGPPCIIFSGDLDTIDLFVELGDKFSVPILKCVLSRSSLNAKIHGYLIENISEKKSIHGVFVDIHGVGVLIKGRSGLGKSEIALELIGKGHTLIADDRVLVYEREPGLLIGTAPEILKKFIEVRGIGVVNVADMFGVGSFRDTKRLRLVIQLEEWNDNTTYDRIGLVDNTELIFNTEVASMVIPITAGRSAAAIVEAASMNFKLKAMGQNAALEFTDNLNNMLRGDSDD